MQPAPVNFSRDSLKHQLNFLIKQEFIIIYSKYRNVPFYLMGVTITVLALIVFTDSDSLIPLKEFLTFILGLAWVLSLLFLTSIVVRLYKRIKWRNKSVGRIKDLAPKLFISFDEEKLSFTTDTYTWEVKWAYYKYYGEDKNSVFLFPEKNIYEATYFSNNEIGVENYHLLRELAKSKLSPLPRKNRT